jgi:hypothetical protein
VDFTNQSQWPAELVRSALSGNEDDPLLAVCILKVTYDVREDGSLRLAEDQLQVLTEPEEGELGWMPADTAPRKPGFDVFALGHARPPEGGPVSSMTVRLQVGEEIRDLAVFGDRHWVRNDDRVAATAPEPFERMPLSWSRSYGGSARAHGYEVPYAYNPAGLGFVLLEDHVDGAPLPNIEDPSARIASWADQPKPACFAPVPISTMFTVDRGMEVDREAGTQRVKPEVFQSAHPSLVFSDVSPGTGVSIYGMGPSGRLGFRMPDLRARVRVAFDDDVHDVEGRVDTLGILADESRIFLLHRSPFKYRVVPGQIRTTTLEVLDPGAPQP